MPSSLVFAALALAWIVVLVPMVARRRQEVRRTADSALAARVVRHGGCAQGARVRPEEVHDMADADDGYPERRYRPGRGGFDPYAAELAARAKYSFRQRVVLCLLLTAVATGLLAAFALPVVWWVHGGTDVILVSYLVYLRRQVRIEQEVRQRRLERARRTRRAIESAPSRSSYPEQPEPAPVPVQPQQRSPQRVTPPPGAAVVDLDDEDPHLYNLEGEPPTPYRRAAGE